jgi:calcineurin-like phosphoesterase family protein
MNLLKQSLFSPLKFRGTDDQFLFWACSHFNHNPNWDVPIYKQRGYNSADECRDGLILNWNKKSDHNTIGFLLGDIMFGMGGADTFIKLLDRLNFKELYICSGNHCAGFNAAIDLTDEHGRYYFNSEKFVQFLPNYFEAFVNGQAIVMSHYPILSFNGQAKSAFHIFGHVHGNLIKSEIGKMYLNSGVRAYEVSVENNPSPISFGELRKIMRDKSGASFDHHSAESANPFG